MAYFMPNKFKDTVMSRWLVLAGTMKTESLYSSDQVNTQLDTGD